MTDPIDEAIADRESGHLDPHAAEAEQDRVERDHWRRLGEVDPPGMLLAAAEQLHGYAELCGEHGYTETEAQALRLRADLQRYAARMDPGPCTPGHCARCVPGEHGEHLDVHTFGQLPCEHVGGRG